MVKVSKDLTQESNSQNIDSYALASDNGGGSLVTYKCSLNVICRYLLFMGGGGANINTEF